MITCTQAVRDLETYSRAICVGNTAKATEVKKRHRISDVYPHEVVQAGLYANMMGKDMYREMNDMMDSTKDKNYEI